MITKTYESNCCDIGERCGRHNEEKYSVNVLNTVLVNLRLEVDYSGYKTYKLNRITYRKTRT